MGAHTHTDTEIYTMYIYIHNIYTERGKSVFLYTEGKKKKYIYIIHTEREVSMY